LHYVGYKKCASALNRGNMHKASTDRRRFVPSEVIDL
jgi:hypothetical protein